MLCRVGGIYLDTGALHRPAASMNTTRSCAERHTCCLHLFAKRSKWLVKTCTPACICTGSTSCWLLSPVELPAECMHLPSLMSAREGNHSPLKDSTCHPVLPLQI